MVEQEEITTLKQWLDTEPGRYTRHWEQHQIKRLVSNVFGYHAIQIGMPHWDLLCNNRISHKWYTDIDPEATVSKTNLLGCTAEQLPFANESIDLIVLPHVLERSSDPHQVLREVQRVLVAEGQVVICGFNPWSLWGLRNKVPGLEEIWPNDLAQQLAPWRVADWLELLSFEIKAEPQGGYVPFCWQSKWLRGWRFMDKWGSRWWPMFGAFYVLKATKRVNGLTLVGLTQPRRWRAATSPVVASHAHTIRELSEMAQTTDIKKGKTKS